MALRGWRGPGLELPSVMFRDARIRLEGRLEELERAVATLRAAIARARGGDFVQLGLAMRLKVDEAQLARVALGEPEVERLQRSWGSLRAEAAQVVRVRARVMRIPEQGALEALVAEPVRYEGAARHPFAWLMPVAIFLFTALEVMVARHPAPLFIHGGVGVILMVSLCLAPRLRLTARRVFIGKLVFELAEVKCVQLERLMRSSFKRSLLTVTLQSGAQVEVRLPAVPEDFLFALRFRAQVPVSRKGWWAWI